MNEIINNPKVTEMIEAFSQKLGVASEYVWGTLVRQNLVFGTVTFLSMLIITFTIVYLLSKLYKNKNQFDEMVHAMAWTFGIIGILVSFGIGVNGLLHLLSPEYYAIKELLSVLQ
jgi:hypothetical protein